LVRQAPCASGSKSSLPTRDALTIADIYVPFTDIGGAVLQKIADAKGVKITATDRE
jgi:hypothetical protein